MFFPDSRAFFDGFPGPYIGSETDEGSGIQSDIAPIHNPEFFGNTMVVNGQTWPVLNVEPRRYRFRLLNGCNSRFLILKMVSNPLADRPAVATLPFGMIGSEGGFLPAPVKLDQLLIGLAERFDVVVDFTDVPKGTAIYLINEGPDEPFGGGVPDPTGVNGFVPSDPNTTGQVMKFVVGELNGSDRSTPPASLVLPAFTPVGPATITRKVSLNEVDSAVLLDPLIGPRAALLGAMDESNNPVIKEWMDAITENPALGVTELWEIYNFTADAHPIHIHEVQFQVVDRQKLELNGEGLASAPAVLVSGTIDPEIWETGSRIRLSPIPARSPGSRLRSTSPASLSGTATSSTMRTTR